MCIEREKDNFKRREVNCLKECALALIKVNFDRSPPRATLFYDTSVCKTRCLTDTSFCRTPYEMNVNFRSSYFI